MEARDYLDHLKSCIDDVASRSKYKPVIGCYILTDCTGRDKVIKAVMHPKDSLRTRYKRIEEMRYYFRDLVM